MYRSGERFVNSAGEPDALSGHEGACLDIAILHGSTQRAHPVLFDLELGCLMRDFSQPSTADELHLKIGKILHALVA